MNANGQAAPEPRLSVITAVLDRADFIGHAIESVRSKDLGPLVEHIVIDGGSTDGTLDILRGYPDLRVVSEPDNGVYDAMNKGIRLARGEIVALLNSDDAYPDGALERVLTSDWDGIDMLVGGARIVDATQPQRPTLSTHPPPPGLRLFDVTRGVPLTNARFIRSSVFDQIGLFDLDYRVAADRDWLIRAWRAGITTATVDAVLYDYGQHPGSLTIGGADGCLANTEYLAMARRFLELQDIEPELRRELRRWRAQVIARSVRDRRGRAGMRPALRQAGAALIREDPLWLARAVTQRWRRPRC